MKRPELHSFILTRYNKLKDVKESFVDVEEYNNSLNKYIDYLESKLEEKEQQPDMTTKGQWTVSHT